MSFSSIFLLQAGKSGMTSMLFMLGAFIIMFFLMIWPQMQRQKKEKKFREALKKGDKVITVGGLHGKIADIEENGTVLLDVGDGTKLRFDKNAIREYAPSQAANNKS